MELKDIVNGLKVLTGRKLSQRAIKSAVPVEHEYTSLTTGQDKSSTRLFKLPSGKLIKVSEVIGKAVTPDMSYGWSIPHYGSYVLEKTQSTFNAAGELSERQYRCYSHNHFSGYGHITVFEPAGRFLGKTISSY